MNVADFDRQARPLRDLDDRRDVGDVSSAPRSWRAPSASASTISRASRSTSPTTCGPAPGRPMSAVSMPSRSIRWRISIFCSMVGVRTDGDCSPSRSVSSSSRIGPGGCDARPGSTRFQSWTRGCVSWAVGAMIAISRSPDGRSGSGRIRSGPRSWVRAGHPAPSTWTLQYQPRTLGRQPGTDRYPSRSTAHATAGQPDHATSALQRVASRGGRRRGPAAWPRRWG